MRTREQAEAKRLEDAALPMLRIYLRRSTDDGQQHFSITVQRDGSRKFVATVLPSRFAVSMDWEARKEYVDDGISGDDFAGRAALQQLLTDTRRGDVIVVRDLSRLGRDALETANVIRALVRDRQARLFYYDSMEEVPMKNVMDVVMSVIRGAGAETELTNIRSRTKEALKNRVERGHIAGGRCYGYDLVRERVGGGEHTIAVINEAQAEIVRRIFREFLEGRGLKKIAIGLNNDGIPSPMAGTRGTGSWSPGAITVMLRNERYHGVYAHGKVKRVKKGKKKVVVGRSSTDPTMEVTRKDMPEWRIIDEDSWIAVQRKIEKRKHDQVRRPWAPTARYALTSLGKCEECGGAIGVSRTKRTGGIRVPAYACQYHHERGSKVCSVSIHQPVDEVEDYIVGYLLDDVLTDEQIDAVVTRARAQCAAFVTSAPEDVERLEGELVALQKQRANLVRLAAHVGDASETPELVEQLNEVRERIRGVDQRLRAAKSVAAAPETELAAFEAIIRQDAARLREVLSEPGRPGLRDALASLFPGGLAMKPDEIRRVWAISGTPTLGGSRLESDPTGNRTRD